MATCRKQKQGAKCTLDKDHYGPYHVDERTDTGWVDETLPLPDPSPDQLPPPATDHPNDGSM